MIARQSWHSEIRRVAVILLVALLLGWLVGSLAAVFAVTVTVILAVWIWQLWRIQRWLHDAEAEPPESFGIWGYIFDRIYQIQSRHRDDQLRLQSALDYMQDSMASIDDGVATLDTRGRIEWCNEAAKGLLGLRYPEDRGQHILNLVRLPEFHDYFSTGEYSEPLELEIVGDEELTLQFEITRFGEGNRMVFVRDVTERVQLEKMRRDFVGNVSHEMRTPLTVIKGYLETLLSDSEIDARYLKPLQQMDQQAARMENLLKDLLWLSRIESLSGTEKGELVDVPALLEELREEWEYNYPERTIEIITETSDSIPGDYRELHSAVANLVMNAVKYSPDDSVVQVRWRREGDEYLLSVKDRGIGIDAIHLPRLTERFYRVDESRNSQTGGTGLGLAIVKHVVMGHKGELRIDSRPGKGSRFTIAIPA